MKRQMGDGTMGLVPEEFYSDFVAAQEAGNEAHARFWPDEPEAACDAYRAAFLEATMPNYDPMEPDYTALAAEEHKTFGAEGRDSSGYGQV